MGQSVKRANIPQMVANTIARARGRCQKEQPIVRTVKTSRFESSVARLQVIRNKFISMNVILLFDVINDIWRTWQKTLRCIIKKVKATWDKATGKKQSWL